MLEQPLLFTDCAITQFFNLPHFQTQSVTTPLVPSITNHYSLTINQYLCDLRDAMPRHWSPSTSHQTPPSVADGFPKGGKYPKDVSLPTSLAYLQPT